MQNDRIKQFHKNCAILFITVFAVMFVLSLWTPMIADDFNYSFGYASDTRIGTLREIWNSMYWHRQMLNARVFSHGWLSLVLMYPRWVYAVINGVVAVLFAWTSVGFFRDQGLIHPVRATTAVCMLLWICMPGFGQVFFWTAGACNYFWGMALSWFVIWRVLRLASQNKKRSRSTCLLLLPAFAAGAWSEHISFAMLMSLFLILVLRWTQTRRFHVAETAVFLSGCAGYLFLMLAPAAKLFQRLHDAGDPTEEGNLTRLLRAAPDGFFLIAVSGLLLAVILVVLLIKQKGRRKTGMLLSLTGAAICGVVTAAAVLRTVVSSGVQGAISSTPAGFFLTLTIYFCAFAEALKAHVKKDDMILSMIFAFSGICGLSLFLFGEYFPIRGFCAPVTLLILPSVYLKGISRNGVISKTAIAGYAILTSCFVLCFLLGAMDIYRVHCDAIEREAAFEEAAVGSKTVVLSPFAFQTKYTAQYGNPDLSPDADWPNGVMADYYGVIRIIVE